MKKTVTVSQHLRSDEKKSKAKKGEGGAYPVEFAVVLIGGEAHGEVDQPPVELHLVVERHLFMCTARHDTQRTARHTTHDTHDAHTTIRHTTRAGERFRREVTMGLR